MTDEEKAEEYADKILSDSIYPFIFNKQKVKAYIIKVYLDSLKCCEEAYNTGLAEGRKEIEQLKKDCSIWESRAKGLLHKNEMVDVYGLQKENAELKEQVDQLSNDNHVLKTSFITQQEQIENLEEDKEQIIFESDLKIKALEEMIEKMKRCENCKHCGLFFDRDEEQFYCCKFYNDCLKYNKWESAE